MNNNNNGEKVRKIMFNEVSLIIAVVGAVSGIIFWVASPQKALELQVVRLQTQIESNETMTAKLQQIKDNDLTEIKAGMEQIRSTQTVILQAITRLETLLEK